MTDWSLLPKDILELISGRFETCFEIVHFRSVCSSWWSALPPQIYLSRLGKRSLLPIFNDNPRFEGDEHCILKKIPVFVLRFDTPFGTDYMLAAMSAKKSGKQRLISPLETSYRYKYGVTTLNTLSSQIISLGHYYKIKFYALTTRRSRTRRQGISIRVAFLPLDDEDGEDFAVLAGVLGEIFMYTSRDKKWIKIDRRVMSYQDMASFKGKFYVVDRSERGKVYAIEPSYEVTQINSQYDESLRGSLVVSGDELLLVRRFTPGEYGDEYMHTWFKVFKLEEEGQRRWVQVNDLKDRVVFLGTDWNLCCSVKELPGMKGNCIVFSKPNTIFERILVFDLETRRTSTPVRGCRGYMGAFGKNQESLASCGIVMMPNPGDGRCIYDASDESE